MAGVTKFVKQQLQNLNIINTGTTPVSQTANVPLPPAPTTVPIAQLQAPVAPPSPLQIHQARQDFLSKTESGSAGRASTILTQRRRRREETPPQAAATPSYTNTVLGQG